MDQCPSDPLPTVTHWRLHQGRFGALSIKYACPQCGEKLTSSAKNAGQTDNCPACHCPFVLPVDAGAVANEVREKRAAEKLAKKEARSRVKEEAKQRKYQAQANADYVADSAKAQSDQTPGTKRCPFCKEEILSEATKCKHCGADIPSGAAMQRCGYGCGLLLIVVISMAVFGRSCHTETSVEKAKRAKELQQKQLEGPDRAGAIIYARRFVKERLLSPGSAKFSGDYLPEEQVTYSNGIYTVAGWVDSQNEFGALLRTYFTVELRGSGNDWTLIRIEP